MSDALAFLPGPKIRPDRAWRAAGPNQGLMQRDDIRAALTPRPPRASSPDLRQAEYELLQAGFRPALQPPRPGKRAGLDAARL
jgi:hypothetical protein